MNYKLILQKKYTKFIDWMINKNWNHINATLTERKIELIEKKSDHHYVPTIYGKSSHKLHDIRDNQHFFSIAQEIYQHGRTYLYYDRLHTIYQAFQNLVRNNDISKPFNAMEIGVYRGGGSYYLASLIKAFNISQAKLFCIDTFEGHSELDIPNGNEGPHEPKQFNQTSYDEVCEYLSSFPFVQVIKSRIQDAKIPDDIEFHLLHLDVDIYAPTYYSLHTFSKQLAQGGIIIIDDYNFTTCPGAKKAVDQFLEETPRQFIKFECQTGQCCLFNLK
ncbi:TPA: TylF/MycF/NovP-related O-methyltransferase [Legionella pneumophila]